MSEIRIDKRKALSLLFGAVKARGRDYVYPLDESRGYGCKYEFDGKPDCMVGQALFDAGVSIETLKALDNKGSISNTGTRDALEDAGVILSEGAVDVFHTAQWKQDAGRCWGTAYDAAKGA